MSCNELEIRQDVMVRTLHELHEYYMDITKNEFQLHVPLHAVPEPMVEYIDRNFFLMGMSWKSISCNPCNYEAACILQWTKPPEGDPAAAHAARAPAPPLPLGGGV